MCADNDVTSRAARSRERETRMRNWALWEEKSEVLIKGPVIVGQTTSAERQSLVHGEVRVSWMSNRLSRRVGSDENLIN